MLSKKISIPVEGNRLLYGAKELENDKFLSDYGIEKRSTLFLVFRLPGGSEQIRVKVLDHTMELSDAPDMITWDDDPENKRVKMPCGHAISKTFSDSSPVVFIQRVARHSLFLTRSAVFINGETLQCCNYFSAVNRT